MAVVALCEVSAGHGGGRGVGKSRVNIFLAHLFLSSGSAKLGTRGGEREHLAPSRMTGEGGGDR